MHVMNHIEVEYDKDTIEILDKEARKEGLGFNEYVTSIVYTTAFNINQEREKAKAKADAEAERENTFYDKRRIYKSRTKKKIRFKVW